MIKGREESLTFAIIAADSKKERDNNHRRSVISSFYEKYISDVIYNAAMAGYFNTVFCFYTEANTDVYYDSTYENIEIMEVMQLMSNDYGYTTSAMRMSPTSYIISISWEEYADDARECLKNLSEE